MAMALSACFALSILSAIGSPALLAQEAEAGGVIELLQEKEKAKEGEAAEAGTAPAPAEAEAEKPKDEGEKPKDEGDEEKAKDGDAKEAAAKDKDALADEKKKAAAAEAAAKEAAEKEAAVRAALVERRAAAVQVRARAAAAAPAAAERVLVLTEETAPDAAVKDEGEAGEEVAPTPRPTPSAPMFWMRDGTRLAGKPRVTELHVATAYGELVIPVSEITRVRFAEAKDTSFVDRLQGLIEQLGHEEFDLREEAMEEIRKIGSVAVETLNARRETTEDEEIKSRLEKLIEELYEEEEEPDEEEIHRVPLKGDEDEIVTFEFTVRGKIAEQDFLVETRYGELTFNRGDIISVVFQEPRVTEKTFVVAQANVAGANAWLDTGIALEKDAPFEVSASGQVTLRFAGNEACGPEGTGNAPVRFEQFPAGALVGRIGSSGPAFLLGAAYEGTAGQAGTLQLAVAVRQNDLSGGQFDVVVRKPNE